MENHFEDKVVYFSHPAFSYRTKTEELCIEIIKEELGAKKVYNPAKYGYKDDMLEKIEKSDAIVGMAVSKKLTYLVWQEMELGEKSGADIYTFMTESRHDIGPLVKGIPDNVKKLTKKESEAFGYQALSHRRESLMSMFLGNWKKRF